MHGSRSWTDISTNSIFYHGLDAASYMRWLAQKDLNSDHLVPQFLHEFTHHWCFQSSVGATLALTELRLNTFMEAYPDGRSIWARDLVAHRCLSRLFSPLAEGLAQLAEFDLTHIDESFNAATPLGVASLCFSQGSEDVFRSWMVQALRRSPEVLERKASLYLKAFEVDDGYLPGYMAAKNVAWSLIGRGYNVPIEVLLAYMRSYFWEDPIYTNIMVSDIFDGSKVASAIERRFRERFVYLLMSPDIPGMIKSFGEKWSPTAPGNCAEELGVPFGEFDVARTRIGQLEGNYLQLLEKDASAVEHCTGLSSGHLRQLLLDLAHARKFALIGEATIRVRDDGSISIATDDPTIAEGKSFKFPEQSSLHPGLYELQAIVPTFGSVLALTAKDESGDVRVLTWWGSGESEINLEQTDFIKYARNTSSVSSVITHLRDRALSNGIGVVKSQALDELTQAISSSALDIYAIAAAPRLKGPSNRISAIRESLRNDALASVFRNDVMAIRLIAGMSLLAGSMELLQNDVYGLISFVRFYFFEDTPMSELQSRFDFVLANDGESIVLTVIEDTALIFV